MEDLVSLDADQSGVYNTRERMEMVRIYPFYQGRTVSF